MTRAETHIPFYASAAIVLASVLFWQGCDTGSGVSCTAIDDNPFISPVVFDGSLIEQSFFGWGAFGIFVREEATDLRMSVEVSDDSVVDVAPRSDSDAKVVLQLRNGGETTVTFSVENGCGDESSVSVSVAAQRPLGRVDTLCSSRPSGQWIDYWPLQEGNSWTFNYESRDADADGGFRRMGSARLSVLSSSCESTHITHLLTVEYDYVIFLNSDRSNTNTHVVYTDSLSIRENAVGQLRVSSFTEVDQIRVREMIVDRYHPLGSPAQLDLHQDYPEIGISESSYLLIKGIGPLRITASSEIGLITQDIRMNLLEHVVASEI